MKLVQLCALFSTLMFSFLAHAGGNQEPVDRILCKGGGQDEIVLQIAKFSNGDVSYCLDYSGSGACHSGGAQMKGWEIEGMLTPTSPVINNTYNAVFNYHVEDTWTRFENEPLVCVIAKK
jgi:hypothetical protein